MELYILTTQTTHHTYFIQKLLKYYPIKQVILETESVTPAFEINHSFEKERDAYEKNIFFDGNNILIKDIFSSVLEVRTINDTIVLNQLKKDKPKMIIVFGTRKIVPKIINFCPDGIINLHGGDPEKYRGLDSHLWAIYHSDFASLITTLHHLNENLDDGNIILQTSIKITSGMPIYKLRHHNTEACIQLVLAAINIYKKHGFLLSRPQRKIGRYYSFMPCALKSICEAKFKKFTGTIYHERNEIII